MRQWSLSKRTAPERSTYIFIQNMYLYTVYVGILYKYIVYPLSSPETRVPLCLQIVTCCNLRTSAYTYIRRWKIIPVISSLRKLYKYVLARLQSSFARDGQIFLPWHVLYLPSCDSIGEPPSATLSFTRLAAASNKRIQKLLTFEGI